MRAPVESKCHDGAVLVGVDVDIAGERLHEKMPAPATGEKSLDPRLPVTTVADAHEEVVRIDARLDANDLPVVVAAVIDRVRGSFAAGDENFVGVPCEGFVLCEPHPQLMS